MTFFMVIAAVYGVLQLAALGWFTGRSVRIGTLLLSIVVGLSGCGVAALLLQYLYTRMVVAASGAGLAEVVRTASYTVDPVVEEFVKLAPLLVVALHLRGRFQRGLTDHVLLGAALGAGFGLLEALLRFSHQADRAIAVPGGWLLPTGLSLTFIPDVGATLASWLPAPATSEFLGFAGQPETYLHLAWSAMGGLGVGVLVRGRGPVRLLGLLPIVLVSAEHCAVNYDLSLAGGKGIGAGVTAPLLLAHRLLWLYPLLSLAVAAYFDLGDLIRGRASLPDVSLSAGSGDPALALVRFGRLRPPWTALIALRFLRLRRSLMYAQARAPAAAVRPWHVALRELREQIDRADTAAAWRRAPTLGALARAALRGRVLLRWQLLVWLVLLLPPLTYLLIGGFPATAWVQDAFTSSAGRLLLLAILIGGFAWLLWQLLSTLRGLSEVLAQPYGEAAMRAELRLMSGIGSLIAGGFSMWLLATGRGLDRPVISNSHVLEALAGAVAAVLLVLALAAIVSMFPAGGLALAFAGGGTLATGITVTPALLGQAAIVGGLSGILLAEAADGGSGDGPGGGSSPGESAQPSNAERFPADSFEHTGYSMDDLASMAYRHTGSGEMHIGGSAPRPTDREVLETLAKGRSQELEQSPNSVQYVWRGVKVIINRNMPWQSTSYYLGG